MKIVLSENSVFERVSLAAVFVICMVFSREQAGRVSVTVPN